MLLTSGLMTEPKPVPLGTGADLAAKQWSFLPQPPAPKELNDEEKRLLVSPGNRVHAQLDFLWGAAAYGSGTMMQVSGQGGAMVFMSMWATGTYFFVSGQMRQTYGPTTDIWTNEAAASWLWMFTTLRQFKTHGRLRWAGYSSWLGFSLATYYSVRCLFARMTG